MKCLATTFAIALMAFGFASFVSTPAQAGEGLVDCDINPDYKQCRLYSESRVNSVSTQFADAANHVSFGCRDSENGNADCADVTERQIGGLGPLEQIAEWGPTAKPDWDICWTYEDDPAEECIPASTGMGWKEDPNSPGKLIVIDWLGREVNPDEYGFPKTGKAEGGQIAYSAGCEPADLRCRHPRWRPEEDEDGQTARGYKGNDNPLGRRVAPGSQIGQFAGAYGTEGKVLCNDKYPNRSPYPDNAWCDAEAEIDQLQEFARGQRGPSKFQNDIRVCDVVTGECSKYDDVMGAIYETAAFKKLLAPGGTSVAQGGGFYPLPTFAAFKKLLAPGGTTIAIFDKLLVPSGTAVESDYQFTDREDGTGGGESDESLGGDFDGDGAAASKEGESGESESDGVQ